MNLRPASALGIYFETQNLDPCWVQWHTPIVSTVRRPKQSNQAFKASHIHNKFQDSLDYRVRYNLKN